MIEDSLSKIKNLFRGRKLAYCQTFKKDDQAARVVLQDLAKFCRAYDSTFAKDDRLSLMLEGRREVWLRIQQYLQLSNEDIYQLHHIKAKGE